jgi:hypothetical protein
MYTQGLEGPRNNYLSFSTQFNPDNNKKGLFYVKTI